MNVNPVPSPVESMLLSDLLRPEHIVVPQRATTIAGAVAEILRRLLDVGAVKNETVLERLHPDVLQRDVVEVGDSAVLPHFRTDAVDDVVLALGVAPAPLAPPRPDATGPRIVVLLLAPIGAATLYLRTIATVARLLRQESVVAQLLAARSPDDVLQVAQLHDLRIQPRLTVRDLMAHHVDSVTPDAPVRDVVDLMVRRRVRAVPVVGEKGEVLGMITERDVMRALMPQIPRAGEDSTHSEGVEPLPQRARDIMTRSVLCVSEDLGLDEIANTMINKDVDQLPVVSEGKLAGVVSRSDMIRKLFGR